MNYFTEVGSRKAFREGGEVLFLNIIELIRKTWHWWHKFCWNRRWKVAPGSRSTWMRGKTKISEARAHPKFG
jgi:hypothetical protein